MRGRGPRDLGVGLDGHGDRHRHRDRGERRQLEHILGGCGPSSMCSVDCGEESCDAGVRCGASGVGACTVTVQGNQSAGPGVDCSQAAACDVSHYGSAPWGSVTCGPGTCNVLSEGGCPMGIDCDGSCACSVQLDAACVTPVGCPAGCAACTPGDDCDDCL